MASLKNRSFMRRGLPAVIFLVGWIALIKGCPVVFPDGIPTGVANKYEGLISVPKEGWDLAVFQSSMELRQNDRLRNSGKQIAYGTCLQASSARAELDDILARSPRDSDGSRALWISFEATPRVASGRCADQLSHGSAMVHYRKYLQIKHVRYAKPLECPSLNLILNHLRCS